MSPPSHGGRLFDLNVEKVLEHWSPAEGVREIIANALDEAALSRTSEPVVEKRDADWVVRDFGRGLEYAHLTQKENKEKLSQPDLVIGKFGVGLKDALAVFERRNVDVVVRSRHGDIRLTRAPKAGFSEIVTLQAEVSDPTDPSLVGSEFTLTGLADSDIDRAKGYFLKYADIELYEHTALGSVLARAETGGLIYVNGMLVSEEPTFLFSYNITSTTAALRRALNRERTNVGRSAYAARVKEILLATKATEVVDRMVGDLELVSRGEGSDEMNWLDVGLHACQLLQGREKVIFVTSEDVYFMRAAVELAEADGYRPVVVPETIARRLSKLKDLRGKPIVDLGTFLTQWNDGFKFSWVEPSTLTSAEQSLWALHEPLLALAGKHARRVKDVRVSETMRLNDEGSAEVTGIWDDEKSWIVIKRTELSKPSEEFVGSFLYLVALSASDPDGGDPAVLSKLGDLLGIIGISALNIANP